MGADEKHEATYHGGEYVPDTEFVRGRFKIARGKKPYAECDAEFDRWLATVKAEAWDEGATFYDDADEIMLSANPYRRES